MQSNPHYEYGMAHGGSSHTSPTRFSAGTLALSSTNSAVIEALIPHYAVGRTNQSNIRIVTALKAAAAVCEYIYIYTYGI